MVERCTIFGGSFNGADPYIVFNTDRVAELRDAFSHYAMTKFGVAAFVVLTYLFAKNAKKDVS